GVRGTLDGIAVDATGTVHIASDDIVRGGLWTATHSTRKNGASAFEHADVPGKLDREIGFGAFAFAVDTSGTAYMMLSSAEWFDDAPNVSHSGPTHTYFARRPAGGTFTVDLLQQSFKASGAIAVDGNNVVHAVLAVSSGEESGTKPVYM